MQTFFITLILVKVSADPGSTLASLNWIFLGVSPPTKTAAPFLMPLPTMLRNLVPSASLPNWQLVITATPGGVPPGGVVVLDALQVNVTWIPCSLPSGQFAGAPATAVVMFRLIPPGPCTKIKNVFPAFALPKVKNASIRVGFTRKKAVALILVAALARSIANTDVTLGTPLITKHAPVINRSCGNAQLPLDGDTEITTGALVPNAIEQATVLVNGPNMLLSPSENVVVTTIVPAPPQHAAGNPEDDVVPNDADTGIVALTKLQLTGVTLTNATVVSAIPSPFVSHDNVAAVVTVLPGLWIGMPVSPWNP
ncbi:MAG TPA: hypothetical protein VLR90_13385 [Blastocatellia bacterium]|nr:hypothetical protein [Blastocatellia bacterium]